MTSDSSKSPVVSQAQSKNQRKKTDCWPFNNTFEFASLLANLAETKKSEQTAILDVSQVSSVADFFVIATANSHTQIRAICHHIKNHLKHLDLTPLSYEEDSQGHWYLIDYGDVVVHVMRPEARELYDLESFWSHGYPMPRDQWAEDLPNNRQQSA